MKKLPEQTRPAPTDDLPSAAPVAEPDLAEEVARLQADRELRDVLAAEGFTGPAYTVFEDDLAKVGHELMMALLSTGYIFIRCRQAKIRLLSLPIPFSDMEDLAQETVANALRTFRRKGLQEGGWQPEKGASLRTYFNGALFREFANIWKKRLRTPADLPVESPEELAQDIGKFDPGPADIYAKRDEIRHGLADLENDRVRVALVLTEDGYSQAEIAEILGPGVSRRSVEGYLRRHRLRLTASKSATTEEGEGSDDQPAP